MWVKSKQTSGFTIVELLVVIVVVGILAAVTIVAYNGVTKRAVGASLQSDLSGAKTQLALYQVENGKYPDANDCTGTTTPAPPKICLKSSSGNSFGSSYVPNNTAVPPTYSLQAVHGDQTYAVTESTAPVLVVVASITCPIGYIPVPGSATYGTSDFCVMKYAASNSGGVAVSVSGVVPWDWINQNDAKSTSLAACSGCHLISEAEWLTIARNVLSVPSNWSGNSVGSGYIYSGHTDSALWGGTGALPAASNDSDGYSGTSNVAPSNQRRTLTLTNGEVIWDLSGNISQWSSGTSTTGQPGSSGYAWRQWNALATSGSLPINPMPSFGTPAASGWAAAQGIGEIGSDSNVTALRGFIRGGDWCTPISGIFNLELGEAPSYSFSTIGFRVAK